MDSTEIYSMIRSILISTKKRISMKQLLDDYKILVGEDLPYRKMGYRDLPTFLQQIPSIIVTKTSDGVFIDYKQSKKSSHIADLIKKSKDSKSKKSMGKFNNFRSIPRPSNGNNSNNKTTKWRPKIVQGRSKLAAVSHNQFIARQNTKDEIKTVVPSKVVAINNYKPIEFNSEKSQVKEQIKDMNKENIRSSSTVLTKQKIIKKMKELNLERDSGNSSPTGEPSNKAAVEFIKTGDPLVDLRNFVMVNNLGDIEVKFSTLKSKGNKRTVTLCKIKCGQHTFSSYPNDFYDERSAETFTAQRALDDLIPKHTRRKSLLISSQEDIIKRIPPMLEKHPNAVWMSQIEYDYAVIYNEQLPTNWLQVIDSSPSVSIERCHDRYLLKYCKPGDILQKGKKIESRLNMYDISIPCNTVLCGENNKINAIITTVTSVSEIWCQQYDTDDYERFLKMSNEMESSYSINEQQFICENINYGSCYVVKYNNKWFRVRALSKHDNNENNIPSNIVSCFMLDYGEECLVPKENIYYLQPQIATIQAQAFVCRLDGFDDFEISSIGSDSLASLLTRKVILEIVPDENCETQDVVLPVIMYDAEDHHSITDDLFVDLTIELANPILYEGITQVFVSNIEDDGDVYIQIRNKSFEYLMALLNDLENTVNIEPPTHLCVSNLTKETAIEGMLFLIKNKKNRWQRATIIDWSPKGELAQIYFIDVGDTDVINVTREIFYPLEELSNIIHLYAPQALKVRCMLDALPGDFKTKASKLMSKDQTVLCKVVDYDSEQVPWVEFFKQSAEGGLFCINKSIAVETELQKVVGTTSLSDNQTNRQKLMWKHVQFQDTIKNVPSGGMLKRPPLPEKGKYFNLSVPFAVNPWNFFVQPLATMNALTTMMEQMQNTYENSQIKPLAIDDVIPGNIYASKHLDQRWYRTTVLKVIHSGSISVFYCDFGYYTSLVLNQLVPLDAKYMELPFQALKAKLAGIKPVKNKWSVDDCDTFKNLITKKQFVSVLEDICKDELYKSDIVLNLHLIDTSTSADVDIHIRDELVKMGIAERA